MAYQQVLDQKTHLESRSGQCGGNIGVIRSKFSGFFLERFGRKLQLYLLGGLFILLMTKLAEMGLEMSVEVPD